MRSSELVGLLRRHRRAVRIVMAVAVIYAGLVALSQPEMYRATDTARFTAAGAEQYGALGSDLETARRQATSTHGLLDLIRQLNLYGGRPDLSAAELAARLGGAITTNISADGRGGAGSEQHGWIVTVTVDMPAATQAVLVAREISARVGSAASEQRMQRLNRARDAVTVQDTELAREAGELQDRAALERAAIGHVPPTVQDRLHQIQAERIALSARRTELGLQLQVGPVRDIVEPALRPATPLPDKTILILFAGVIAGGALALALAFLLDLRRPVLRSARQMEKHTGLAPLVCIPVLDAGSADRPFRNTTRADSV